MTALDRDVWEPRTGAFGKYLDAMRGGDHRLLLVRLREATPEDTAGIFVVSGADELDADDAQWLASRLLEASEAIRGRALTFATLPAAVANDAVRAVEDAIDDNHQRLTWEDDCFTGRQGPSTIDALLDLGWRPMVQEREIGSAS